MPDGIIQMSFMPIPFTEPQPRTNRSEHSFARKIQAGFWVVGAILLSIGLASYQSLREFDETVDWAAHSQEILVRLQTVLSDVQDIEIGLRGYIMTGKERFLSPYKNGLDALSRDRKALSTIVQEDPLDHPDQPHNLATLEALIDKKVALLNAMLALRKDLP
jgi:CHASE3 domain sensor protein